ncbi:MAG TPA: peptidoglycan-associated lipoprotein Pal [Steroidobacteraceae bacterium]|jgi:peptidoglycan-associated lipoprotein|nr:peptidoglycan-associated lipoprotein Pal [Steroidobacteraceae bacterium]
MNKTLLILIAVLGVSLAAGCSSKKPRPTATSTNSAVPADQSQTAGADASSAGVVGGTGAGVAGPSGAQLQNRTIYFDFDSSEVKADYNGLVAAHARYLGSNPSIRVRLEGNTDERGSREYNIGLGERRAQSVRRALTLQGVTDAQITTVSYGEERPAVTGHTEEAWARNRRVDIVYLN